MKENDIVRLDFPSHPQHGAAVRIVRIDPAFNLAPPGEAPILSEVIFIRHPNWPDAVGVGRDWIGGSAENLSRLREERGEDESQGELLL